MIEKKESTGWPNTFSSLRTQNTLIREWAKSTDNLTTNTEHHNSYAIKTTDMIVQNIISAISSANAVFLIFKDLVVIEAKIFLFGVWMYYFLTHNIIVVLIEFQDKSFSSLIVLRDICEKNCSTLYNIPVISYTDDQQITLSKPISSSTWDYCRFCSTAIQQLTTL